MDATCHFPTSLPLPWINCAYHATVAVAVDAVDATDTEWGRTAARNPLCLNDRRSERRRLRRRRRSQCRWRRWWRCTHFGSRRRHARRARHHSYHRAIEVHTSYRAPINTPFHQFHCSLQCSSAYCFRLVVSRARYPWFSIMNKLPPPPRYPSNIHNNTRRRSVTYQFCPSAGKCWSQCFTHGVIAFDLNRTFLTRTLAWHLCFPRFTSISSIATATIKIFLPNIVVVYWIRSSVWKILNNSRYAVFCGK